MTTTLYFCAGPSCPGLSHRASDVPHPVACSLPVAVVDAAATARLLDEVLDMEDALRARWDAFWGRVAADAGLPAPDMTQPQIASFRNPAHAGALVAYLIDRLGTCANGFHVKETGNHCVSVDVPAALFRRTRKVAA